MVYMPYMESFGKSIKQLIRLKGVSYYRIAKDLGIDYSSFYRSIGDHANPEWKRIKQILDYLGYDIKFVQRKGVKVRRTESRGKKKGGV